MERLNISRGVTRVGYLNIYFEGISDVYPLYVMLKGSTMLPFAEMYIIREVMISENLYELMWNEDNYIWPS